MKNTKKGFTLIELLVVIAIIGVLSAIGLVALTGARGKARDAKRVSDLRQYALSYAAFFDTQNPATYDTPTSSGFCVDNTRASQCPSLNSFFATAASAPEDPQGTLVCEDDGSAGTHAGTLNNNCPDWSAATAATAPCYYTIMNESATQFVVGAVLESGTGGIVRGPIAATETGIAACTP